jgi:hypothetical protein
VWRERGRGGLYRRGWLGRGARVAALESRSDGSGAGACLGQILREVADDMQAPPVGICGSGGHTDSGAATLAGWAGFLAWTE